MTAYPRCEAYDNARQCRKRGNRRYKGGSKPLCRAHYQRAMKRDGDTRTLREIIAAEAIERREAERQRQRRILGKETNE